MQSIAFGRRARAHKYVICSAALILLLNISALAQRNSTEWYNSSVTERGQLSDLKDKRRVYVTLLVGGFDNSPSYELYRATIGQQINQGIKQYAELELVKSPAEADFIIDVWVNPVAGEAVSGRPLAEQSTDIRFTVYTRSEKPGNGHYARRMTAQRWNTARGDAPAIVRQEIAAFIKDLKSVQGK